jgi:hypothetical protein
VFFFPSACEYINSSDNSNKTPKKCTRAREKKNSFLQLAKKEFLSFPFLSFQKCVLNRCIWKLESACCFYSRFCFPFAFLLLFFQILLPPSSTAHKQSQATTTVCQALQEQQQFQQSKMRSETRLLGLWCLVSTPSEWMKVDEWIFLTSSVFMILSPDHPLEQAQVGPVGKFLCLDYWAVTYFEVIKMRADSPCSSLERGVGWRKRPSQGVAKHLERKISCIWRAPYFHEYPS